MKLYRCYFLLDNINYCIEVPGNSVEDVISTVKSRFHYMKMDILNVEELNMF